MLKEAVQTLNQWTARDRYAVLCRMVLRREWEGEELIDWVSWNEGNMV